jgi:hypothetical protein
MDTAAFMLAKEQDLVTKAVDLLQDRLAAMLERLEV